MTNITKKVLRMKDCDNKNIKINILHHTQC